MDLQKPIEEMTTAERRLVARIVNLQDAVQRLGRRIELNPEDPRVPKWIKRLEEYQQSLTNIRDHGRESLKGSNVSGVEIEVPTFDFSKLGHPPEVAEEEG